MKFAALCLSAVGLTVWVAPSVARANPLLDALGCAPDEKQRLLDSAQTDLDAAPGKEQLGHPDWAARDIESAKGDLQKVLNCCERPALDNENARLCAKAKKMLAEANGGGHDAAPAPGGAALRIARAYLKASMREDFAAAFDFLNADLQQRLGPKERYVARMEAAYNRTPYRFGRDVERGKPKLELESASEDEAVVNTATPIYFIHGHRLATVQRLRIQLLKSPAKWQIASAEPQ